MRGNLEQYTLGACARPRRKARLTAAWAILSVLACRVCAGAQAVPEELPPLTYHHVGEGRGDRETEERTFAACKVQADIASPMIEGSWLSLSNWQIARDDCMRAHGWVRE